MKENKAQQEENEPKRRKSYYRWVCPVPGCDLIVHITKPVANIKCGDCDVKLENTD